MLPTEVHGEVRVRVRFNPDPNPNPNFNPKPNPIPHTIVWTGGRPHAIVAPFDPSSQPLGAEIGTQRCYDEKQVVLPYWLLTGDV